ncbi:hypothetical protein THAOC_26832, partial [Thalassiosira oceanica]
CDRPRPPDCAVSWAYAWDTAPWNLLTEPTCRQYDPAQGAFPCPPSSPCSGRATSTPRRSGRTFGGGRQGRSVRGRIQPGGAEGADASSDDKTARRPCEGTDGSDGPRGDRAAGREAAKGDDGGVSARPFPILGGGRSARKSSGPARTPVDRARRFQSAMPLLGYPESPADEARPDRRL